MPDILCRYIFYCIAVAVRRLPKSYGAVCQAFIGQGERTQEEWAHFPLTFSFVTETGCGLVILLLQRLKIRLHQGFRLVLGRYR